MTIDEAITHAKEVSSRKFDDRVHCIRCAEEHEQLAEWLEELKHYKQLEETGRLIELPCAVGDTVWTIDLDINFIDDFKVTDIDIMKEGIAICNHYLGYYFDVNDFGRTVFLTKEEAEAKLKELRGEQE